MALMNQPRCKSRLGTIPKHFSLHVNERCFAMITYSYERIWHRVFHGVIAVSAGGWRKLLWMFGWAQHTSHRAHSIHVCKWLCVCEISFVKRKNDWNEMNAVGCAPLLRWNFHFRLIWIWWQRLHQRVVDWRVAGSIPRAVLEPELFSHRPSDTTPSTHHFTAPLPANYLQISIYFDKPR